MKQLKNLRVFSASLMIILLTISLIFPLFASGEKSSQEISPSASGIETELGRVQLSTEQYTTLVMLMLDYIRRFYVDEVDANVLFEGAMKGMFESLKDPYSQYLTFKDMEELKNTTVGDFAGIGIYHHKKNPKSLTSEDNVKDGYIYVVAPIEDSPAYKAGIHAGDYITKINGESVVPMSVDDITKKLKGKKGDSVELTILRGSEITFDIKVTRDNITIPTVKSAVIPKKVGYVRITQFTPHTAEDVKKAIEDLTSQDINSLILDLRMNPGGVFQGAIKIADYFFDEGLIVSTKSRIRTENVEYSAMKGTLIPKDMPIVALIDKGSASASEVLVGALKDRKRAYVIGEKSFGKGVVQNVIPGYLGTGFKLTTARYYTPNGISIDKKGIEPDLEVKSPDFTPESERSYKKMLEDKIFENFVEKNPKAGEQEINSFLKELHNKGFIFDDDLIGKVLISMVYQKRGESQPVYNLSYDKPLRKALKYLKSKV